MTRKVSFAVLALLLTLPMIAGRAAAEGAKASSPVEAGKPALYGAPLGEGATLPLAAILLAPDDYAGKQLRIAGQVRTACTKKGCWMELATPDGAGPGCRVTFKDYGFFVPKDSAGSEARIEGVVQVKTLAKKEVDHLAAEGASFVRAEDGTAREIRIVASGVELSRAPATK